MVSRLDKDTVLLVDAMRGIAALIIVFTHAFDLAVADVYGWNYADTPELWRWARASFGYGGFLVWCFFVISGFCIHQSIAPSMADGSFSWKNYALARISRIYPLFMLGLVLAVAAWLLHEEFSGAHHEHPWPELTATFLSLQILTTPFPAYETSWSLSCEMIYYAVWPAALVISARNARRATFLSLLGVLVVSVLIMTLWKGLHRMEHSAFVEGVWIVSVLFPVWVCGAWLSANLDKVRQKVTRRVWFISIVLCLLSETLLIVMKFQEQPHWALNLAGWSSIPGLMLFLAGAHHARLSLRKWAEPVCQWLGRFSYPCYILHMQLLLLLDHFVDLFAGEMAHRHPVWHAVGEFLIVLSLLALIGPALEERLMEYRKKWLQRLKNA